MKYGWQIEKIMEKKNAKTLLNDSEGFVYEEMLCDYAQQSAEVSPIKPYSFKKALNRFSLAKYRDALELVLYFGKNLVSMDLELPSPSLYECKDEDIVQLASIYMRRKEPTDYPYFRKIVSKKDHIQFRYLASLNTFLGKSYYLSRDEYYILVHKINGIQDSVTLLHETGHIENYLKYDMNLSYLYAELTPMIREHYSFDFFKSYAQPEEVEKQRILSLNHYLMRILNLYYGIAFLLKLKGDSHLLKHFVTHYDDFSSNVDISYLYGLLTGELEQELGYAFSFLASLDIYSHCEPKDSRIFVTSYEIGTREVTKKVADRVFSYLTETLKPYQKTKKK